MDAASREGSACPRRAQGKAALQPVGLRCQARGPRARATDVLLAVRGALELWKTDSTGTTGFLMKCCSPRSGESLGWRVVSESRHCRGRLGSRRAGHSDAGRRPHTGPGRKQRREYELTVQKSLKPRKALHEKEPAEWTTMDETLGSPPNPDVRELGVREGELHNEEEWQFEAHPVGWMPDKESYNRWN